MNSARRVRVPNSPILQILHCLTAGMDVALVFRGTPFVIAFVCCTLLYVGVGVGYNVRVQGMAPAPSSHPHYHLWTQAGGLIV
eukprot:COSAG02_NODE_54600_length_295_cov_0.780612_1_plen_82_part_01